MLAKLLQLENLTCGNVGHSRYKIQSLQLVGMRENPPPHPPPPPPPPPNWFLGQNLCNSGVLNLLQNCNGILLIGAWGAFLPLSRHYYLYIFKLVYSSIWQDTIPELVDVRGISTMLETIFILHEILEEHINMSLCAKVIVPVQSLI